jgi:hypothetical protein
MKRLIFLLLVTSNILGQKVTYIDSIYFKYEKYGNKFIKSKVEPDEYLSSYTFHLRIATDETINKFLTDTLNTIYNAKYRSIKSKRINKTLGVMNDGIALDSNSNVLYVRVISPRCKCYNSLLDMVIGDEEVTSLLSDKKFKWVISNYVQIQGRGCNDLIFVSVKLRGKKIEKFIFIIPR